ncbi:MAG TPA: hypothetical protein VK612_05315 [Pyrinomonadaceae bacterium]|nr:hypothetical protein [Pyrinomonadaceae bacterium]
MANLGFKEINLENWSQPDSIHTFFVKLSPTGEGLPMTAEDWIQPLLNPRLLKTVPNDVRDLFEVARGAMIYGYYFYPLWTLGTEQMFRVVDAAVSHKCGALGAPKSKKGFADKVEWLEIMKAIASDDKETFSEIRKLRNSSSHPANQSIVSPSTAISLLRLVTKVINSIFDAK